MAEPWARPPPVSCAGDVPCSPLTAKHLEPECHVSTQDGVLVAESNAALVWEQNDSEACRAENFNAWNNLAVGIEVRAGPGGGWHVLCPGCPLELEDSADIQIEVRLRDARKFVEAA